MIEYKTVYTNHEEAGFEKARIKHLASLACLSQHLTHVTDPEMTRRIEHVADVAEHFVHLDLLSNNSNQT